MKATIKQMEKFIESATKATRYLSDMYQVNIITSKTDEGLDVWGELRCLGKNNTQISSCVTSLLSWNIAYISTDFTEKPYICTRTLSIKGESDE